MSYIIRVNPTETHSEAEFSLGGIGTDDEGNEWMYVQANGALSDRDLAIITPGTWQAEPADTTHSDDRIGAPCGVAQVAFADNDYGWLQRTGTCNVTAQASCAAYASLTVQSTTNDGHVDDNTTAGSEAAGRHCPDDCARHRKR